REELRAKLWPADTFVDFDHGLNAAVKRLRDAIGDTAEKPRYIETLPRRGYRFIAPVEPSANGEMEGAVIGSGTTSRRLRAWHDAIGALGAALVLAVTVSWFLKRSPTQKNELMVQRLTTNSSDSPITRVLLSPDG